jgi:dipeptidyl-peptidase-4
MRGEEMNAQKSARSALALCLLMLLAGAGLAQKKFTVEAIYGSRELAGKTVSGVQWMTDGSGFTYFQRDTAAVLKIWKYDFKTKKRSVLIDSKKVEALSEERREKRNYLGNYFWSSDGKSILLPSKNDLYLYEVASGQTRRLTSDSLEERDPQFSPDGRKIAFLKKHNLHVLDIASGQTRQLTTQGEEHILVGKFDWVYEEEFNIRTAFFWSPDSRHLAYFQLDERQVPEFPLTDFIPVHNEYQPMRYPKPGDKNSVVKIGVVSVESSNGNSTRWMDLGGETDVYIPRIKWTNDPQKLSIIRLNRDQNHLELLLADVNTGATEKIFEEKEVNGWISINDDWRFLKNGKSFLWLSMADGYSHLYLYDMSGKLIRQITKGSWEVSGVAGVDEKSGTIYFTATEKSPLERHLYKIKLDGSGMVRLSSEAGTHRITMAPDARYYLDGFSSVITPMRYSLHTNTGALVEVVEPNDIPALKGYTLSPPIFGTLTTPRGDVLNYWMIKPANFDASKKYPVLTYVYGGPGRQTVTNSWSSYAYWHQLLADKGYVIFSVDNRGTGARGKAFMMSTYKNLGALEVEDQIAAAQWLGSQPYVDAARIGIWGWSYGGYMAASCILKGAEVFKTAVSVAPVTDWRNYDTIYTERYMLTPEKNPEGYKNTAPVNFAKELKGNLLLVHGLNDDNVHASNALQLAMALQEARKPFSLMIYPRKDHGINGQNTRVHLFNMITDYLLKNL